jgi:CBS domain-containing protein
VSTPIARVLDRKGHEVVTTTVDARLGDVVGLLAEHGIGAVVVVDAEGRVQGIVSERDVVSRVAAHGTEALSLPVGEAMTSPATTCTPEATIDQLSATMTEQRHRHLPVVVDDRLVGIVSIGDVVKWNLDELRTRAQQLTEYVSGSY